MWRCAEPKSYFPRILVALASVAAQGNEVYYNLHCTVAFGSYAQTRNLVTNTPTTDLMKVQWGKVHHYLGMTMDFRVPGEIQITMYDYIKKLIDSFPEDMIGSKHTAAPEHLFRTDEEAIKLLKDTEELFHKITAQVLLWIVGKRRRPDLQLGTSFLCTRVAASDEQDYKKLHHHLIYLQITAFLPLILKVDGKGISLYIDRAHGVHADMKGHVGVYTTMGTGAVYASSTKSKINTVSSIETEVISVGEKLPKHLWFRNFLVEQTGDPSQVYVLYKDNKSIILPQNNGRLSCHKGSKHIHIIYFLITDHIKQKEIRVEYFPIGSMVADYFIKPLQGSLFR